MLTTEQRREKLEILLERVQRNRSMLEPGGIGLEEKLPVAAAEAVAPVAGPAAQEPAPPVSVEPDSTIELSPDDIEPEVGDDGLELDLSGDEDGGGAFIDLTADDEVPAAAKAPAISAAFEETPVPEPTAPAVASRGQLTPTPSPELELAADQTLVDDGPLIDDDEPEIEVSYGTEEALALQAELGLGESGIPTADVSAESDQLTLGDMQLGRTEPQSGADIEMDNLPAPAPQETPVEDLLEPSMLSPEVPKAAEASPMPPAAIDIAPKAPKEPRIEEAEAPRTRLRAKTEEDLTGPLIELSLDDSVADEELPAPKVEAKADASDALADALTADSPAPPQEAPAAAAEPSAPHQYEASRSDKGDVQVAEMVGTVPKSRVKTFGELVLAALFVGKKKAD